MPEPVHARRSRSRGSVLATFQTTQDFGAIIGPILIGVVADMWGLGAAFALTGVISLVAILPWLSARETLPSAEAGVGTRSP
ncbi:MAG: hypothetical protein M3519_06685 [Actinomycetota bacterium]|nr:hypothetical protein [Actinomycetota bacterium]